MEKPGVLSQEVVRGSFNAKCDVWSLGCCLYALLCHHPLRLEDHLKGEGTSQGRNELKHLKIQTSGWDAGKDGSVVHVFGKSCLL